MTGLLINGEISRGAVSDKSESGIIEVSPDITAEMNENGELIGIEILNDNTFIRSSISESVQA